MNRRNILRFVVPSVWTLVTLGAGPVLAQAATARLPLSTAINRAGRMRAMSQRMSKAYVQASLQVLPERAHGIMLDTQRLIAQGMGELTGGSPPPAVQPLLQALHQDWQALLRLAAAPVRPSAVAEVVRTADVMLESADQVTRAYQSLSAQGAARVVNVAGRQRMLSQRAARAYFLLVSGHAQPSIRQQMDVARKEFSEGLAFLQASPVSTDSIRNELELARGQWLFFDMALQKQPGSDSLQTIATTSERMYEVMDSLTGLYDSVVRELFT